MNSNKKIYLDNIYVRLIKFKNNKISLSPKKNKAGEEKSPPALF